MNKDIFDTLNNVYKPIWEMSVDINDKLSKAGFEVRNGFYNNHYIKYNNDFIVEYFPIPVITIANIGDIGIDIDSIWIEIKLTKEKAIHLNYPNLTDTFNMEVYGADNYLNDFYNKQSDPYKTAELINNSNESHICITIYYQLDFDIDKLINIIKIFSL